MKTKHSISRILEIASRVANAQARSQVEDVRVYSEYAEPGYTTPESGLICLGNWNRVSKFNATKHEYETVDDTMPRLGKILEKLGAELEWGDEWCDCSQCGRLVRTQGDSYGWQPSYYAFESELVCRECLLEDESLTEQYLTELEGDARKAVTFKIDLEKAGYRQLNAERYENGWYGGQDDDPKKIAASLEARGVTRYLFTLDNVRQFDLSFSCWVHESQIEKALAAPVNSKADRDPKDVLSDALKGAARKTVKS